MDIFSTWIGISNYIGNRAMGLVQAVMSFGLIYGLYRLIKYFIHYHAKCQNDFAEQWEQKQGNQKKMEDINRELDEIEASLDAVRSSEKVKPIWEIPAEKR